MEARRALRNMIVAPLPRVSVDRALLAGRSSSWRLGLPRSVRHGIALLPGSILVSISHLPSKTLGNWSFLIHMRLLMQLHIGPISATHPSRRVIPLQCLDCTLGFLQTRGSDDQTIGA